MSVLPHLGKCLNIFNRNFKYKVVGELWDFDKFSIKEACHNYSLEGGTSKMWAMTKAISNFERMMQEDKRKNWREIKTYYEQIGLVIDNDDGSLKSNQEAFEEGNLEDAPDRTMMWFMFNRITIDCLDNLVQ